jgi:ABC-type transport system involved in cytochrome bd biosynthesis fused ATPase/permease subunit
MISTPLSVKGERLSGGRYQRLASRTQSAEPSLLAPGEMTALD